MNACMCLLSSTHEIYIIMHNIPHDNMCKCYIIIIIVQYVSLLTCGKGENGYRYQIVIQCEVGVLLYKTHPL
jgi:hypothetical protein